MNPVAFQELPVFPCSDTKDYDWKDGNLSGKPFNQESIVSTGDTVKRDIDSFYKLQNPSEIMKKILPQLYCPFLIPPIYGDYDADKM